MKYFVVLTGVISIFLLFRFLDKDAPLIGENIEEPFLNRMASYQPDERPSGLPNLAFWRGGPDGGNYIVLPTSVASEEGVYYAEIYQDHSGDLIYKGKFQHQHSKRTTCEKIDPTMRLDIFWDGEVLFIENTGQYLLPIEENNLGTSAEYLSELGNVDIGNFCKG